MKTIIGLNCLATMPLITVVSIIVIDVVYGWARLSSLVGWNDMDLAWFLAHYIVLPGGLIALFNSWLASLMEQKKLSLIAGLLSVLNFGLVLLMRLIVISTAC
jgi:hypothetical protein